MSFVMGECEESWFARCLAAPGQAIECPMKPERCGAPRRWRKIGASDYEPQASPLLRRIEKKFCDHYAFSWHAINSIVPSIKLFNSINSELGISHISNTTPEWVTTPRANRINLIIGT